MNVWTVLWVSPEPFVYRSRPVSQPPQKPEVRVYTAEEVVKHERMVRKHIPDCKFRCLTNINIPGIECVPLSQPIDRWWSQMEVFRPDLPEGRNVYFDLDTVLIRGIDEIINFPAPAAFIQPGPGVGSDRPGPWQDQEGYLRIPKYQCSVKVWDSEYGRRFWQKFTASHRARLASDQDFLAEEFPSEARMPTAWFRKITHAKELPPPPCKLVMTMGCRNDEAARRFPWVKEIWG